LKLESVLVEDVIVPTVADLLQWCGEWASDLASRQIILLEGPMGVGKTQLVRSLLQYDHFDESQSPTFTVINRYQTSRGSVAHVDLYRVKDEEDLESTGFWDLFAQEKGLILIEWAERMGAQFLPPDWKIWKFQMEFVSQPIQGRRVRRYDMTWKKTATP
jgi:tRNA threonylcarbamoyladenosine biosynthesis protein TsaE